MGGGHVSRPDFGMTQADPNHPLTEFYLALQRALDRDGVFTLPALYAGFRAPARRIYADEARDYLTISDRQLEGGVCLVKGGPMQVSYSSLYAARDGAPAALLLTEACSHAVCAVQLLPPFLWEDPLPAVPDSPSAVCIQLTEQDVFLIDADSAALGRRLAKTQFGKCWLCHPKADTWLAGRVALFQRLYRG